MSDTTTGHPAHPGRYQIRLEGHLDPRWAARFEGMALTSQSDGTTVLDGPVIDQAALHGLLATLRDLGLPLLSLTPIEPSQPDAQTTES